MLEPCCICTMDSIICNSALTAHAETMLYAPMLEPCCIYTCRNYAACSMASPSIENPCWNYAAHTHAGTILYTALTAHAGSMLQTPCCKHHATLTDGNIFYFSLTMLQSCWISIKHGCSLINIIAAWAAVMLEFRC